jgi:hypothetical protein
MLFLRYTDNQNPAKNPGEKVSRHVQPATSRPHFKHSVAVKRAAGSRYLDRAGSRARGDGGCECRVRRYCERCFNAVKCDARGTGQIVPQNPYGFSRCAARRIRSHEWSQANLTR